MQKQNSEKSRYERLRLILKSALPQIGRECGSLKVYEDVFRYKIVCILQRPFEMCSRIYIPCGRDFLALRMQRKIQPQHCHADALARRRIALLHILVGAAGMCAIGTESRDHCERRDA